MVGVKIVSVGMVGVKMVGCAHLLVHLPQQCRHQASLAASNRSAHDAQLSGWDGQALHAQHKAPAPLFLPARLAPVHTQRPRLPPFSLRHAGRRPFGLLRSVGQAPAEDGLAPPPPAGLDAVGATLNSRKRPPRRDVLCEEQETVQPPRGHRRLAGEGYGVGHDGHGQADEVVEGQHGDGFLDIQVVVQHVVHLVYARRLAIE